MSDRRLGGRYEIQARVGGGGMAVVYRGHDLLLDRTVAIKVLRSQFGTDDEFIRRFRREAQAAARLTHSNVVSIYDVGQEEDTHYIVMEYVEGETLKDLIKREAPLPVEKVVDIAIQIADALDHAHHKQIIHRDIKPHNILISKSGRVKVTDFGIARAVTSATITHTGSVLGSVHYFSPEQAKGGLTGEKSDIYSLGVVLYEMVTGYLPFSGESPISVALKHLQEDFQDPREINPSLPQSVENIILKALNKDPDKRYSSAREMVVDLETCLLPERLHEEKYVSESEDYGGDEPTIIIPAIRAEQLKRNNTNHTTNHTSDEEEDEDAWKDDTESVGRRKWVKPVIWVAVLSLLFGLGAFALNQIKEWFEVKEVAVPFVEGKPVDEAVNLLNQRGLQVQIEERYDKNTELGYVIKQDPSAGTTMKENTYVTIIVSKGKQTVLMPDVRSLPRRQAEAEFNGYLGVTINEEFSEEIPVGNVIRQEPKEGTEVVPEETSVTLTISKGQENFEMPSLIGKTRTEVESILLKNNLVLKNVKNVESYFEKGRVVSQWPIQPGERVSAGQEITIEISSGMKADAVEFEHPVSIPVTEPGTKTDITIYISDARYNDYLAVSETITNSKEYTILFVISPNRNATYTVYKNGVLQLTDTITYDEVVGGD